MHPQELRKLLEKADDKLNIFANPEILNQYNFNSIEEILDLIRDFLSDSEKLKLFTYPHFQGYKICIIECISDKNIILQLLHNDSIMSRFPDYVIVDIIESLSDEVKTEILNDRELIVNKFHLFSMQITELTKGLSSEEAKDKILEIYRIKRIR